MRSTIILLGATIAICLFTWLACVEQFVSVNVAIGLGIAADAMVATVSRFRRFVTAGDAFKWASAIGATHTVFPMLGFIGFWYVAEAWPALKFIIFVIGTVIMTLFIRSVMNEVSGLGEEDDEEEQDSGWFVRVINKYSPFWAAVWGVSIDALVTGPGKTSATAHWTESQVWWSFPLVGGVVFGLVVLSAWPAVLLRAKWHAGEFRNTSGLALFTTTGAWVEIAIFTYFGALAFCESLIALGVELPWFTVLGVASVAVGLMVRSRWKLVWDAQFKEAKEILAA